jgi:hypothetical protein
MDGICSGGTRRTRRPCAPPSNSPGLPGSTGATGQPVGGRHVQPIVDMDTPRWSPRRFRTPRRGDEVDLRLRSDLSGELALPAAAARVRELRASGVDHVRVRVVKAPRLEVLSAQDAVKVAAPDLLHDTTDPTVYVRLEFLDLPTI